MTKEQLKEEFLSELTKNPIDRPLVATEVADWWLTKLSQATKEAKEADKEIIKNYIKAMMKFELGQNARIAPGETEYNKALFNVLDFLNKDN